MHAVRAAFEDGLELLPEGILTARDETAQILQSFDFRVGVEHQPPEFDVMFGTTFDLLFEMNKFVGVLQIAVDF